MHTELCLGWALVPQHTQVKVSGFLTFLPEIGSFCPSPSVFFVFLFFWSVVHVWHRKQTHWRCHISFVAFDVLNNHRRNYGICVTHALIMPLAGIRAHTRTHTHNLLPWQHLSLMHEHTRAHTHRRQMGQWSKCICCFLICFSFMQSC